MSASRKIRRVRSIKRSQLQCEGNADIERRSWGFDVASGERMVAQIIPKEKLKNKFILNELFVIFALVLAACGAPSSPATTRPPSATRTPAPRQPTAIPRGYIGHDTVGDAWPLSVDSGTIVCDRNAILLRTADRRLYAVNGAAIAQATSKGWRDVHELAVDAGNGTIKSLQPLLDLGLTLCPQR